MADDDAPAKGPGPFFINRDTDALIRVREVDASYAYIETLFPGGQTFSMPIGQYDSQFVDIFRPATEAELAKLGTSTYRPPANAPDDWR